MGETHLNPFNSFHWMLWNYINLFFRHNFQMILKEAKYHITNWLLRTGNVVENENVMTCQKDGTLITPFKKAPNNDYAPESLLCKLGYPTILYTQTRWKSYIHAHNHVTLVAFCMTLWRELKWSPQAAYVARRVNWLNSIKASYIHTHTHKNKKK